MTLLELLQDHIFEINTPENPCSNLSKNSDLYIKNRRIAQLPALTPENKRDIYAIHDVLEQKIYVRRGVIRRGLFTDDEINHFLQSHQLVDERRVPFYKDDIAQGVYVFDMTRPAEPVEGPTNNKFLPNQVALEQYKQARQSRITIAKREGTYKPRVRNRYLLPYIKENMDFFELNIYSFETERLPGTNRSETYLMIDGSGAPNDKYKTPQQRGTATYGLIYKRSGVGFVGKDKEAWWVLIDSRMVKEWEAEIRFKNVQNGLSDEPIDFKEDARFSHVENRYLAGTTVRLMAFNMLAGNDAPLAKKKKTSPNELRAKRAERKQVWRKEFAERVERGEVGNIQDLPSFLQENSYRRYSVMRIYGSYMYIIVRELRMHPFDYTKEVGFVGRKVIHFRAKRNVQDQVVGSQYCAMFNVEVLRDWI